MPELPEVETVLHTLEHQIQGRKNLGCGCTLFKDD